MKKVFSYAGKLKRYTFSAVVLLLLSVVFGLIPYVAISELVTNLMQGTTVELNYVLLICVIVFGSLALKAITMGIGLTHSHTAAFGILCNIRKSKAKDMIEHPLGDILNQGVGKYKKGFVEDIDLLENMIAHMIPEGLPNFFIVVIAYVYIFILDYRLGLLSLVMILAGIIPMFFMMIYGMKAMSGFYAALDNMNETIIEYVGGMEVIKVFGKTSGSFEKLKNSVLHARDLTYTWFKSTWRDMSIMNALLPCTILFALPVGISLYKNDSISLNNFVLIMLLNLSLSGPIVKLITFMPIFPQVGYAIKKIEGTFSMQPIKTGNVDAKPNNFDISFDKVDFAYDEAMVLKDLNLTFKQGELSVLVGESGSGKSTVAKLIVHFWDVKEGKISIGGTDIREFTSKSLMSMISYVSQDSILFNDSIMENLLMGKEGATKEDVINACKLSCCHDFIMSLDDGYDTVVGTLGGKLSGGERQRITIARAMLKNAPIVILDESTAHTDSENEKLIQTALSNLLKGKTVIVIAHRLNTIVEADNIVVLNNGTLEASGRHEDILKTSPTYQKLWAQSIKTTEWSIGEKEDKIDV